MYVRACTCVELFNADKINATFFTPLLISVMLKITPFPRVVFKIRCVVKSTNDFFSFLTFTRFLLTDARTDTPGATVNPWLIGSAMVPGSCTITCQIRKTIYCNSNVDIQCSCMY